jgi:phospholipase C
MPRRSDGTPGPGGTAGPTSGPTGGPTSGPTGGPTSGPTGGPTSGPTGGPTSGPTGGPTSGPTTGPTSTPTARATENPSPTPTPVTTPTPIPTPVPISHVVVIIQENRSFDNLFQGFPGANTASSGLDSTGQVVNLVERDLSLPWDVFHTHGTFETEYDNGKLDGFDQAKVENLGGKQYPGSNFAYSYVNHGQIQPYLDMAQGFALSDNTFQSNSGPSFPAHLLMIAGYSDWAAENPNKIPWGCDGGAKESVRVVDPSSGKENASVRPCFDTSQIPLTLADELDAANLSWRYYAPQEKAPTNYGRNWSAFDAIASVRYGPDWSNVINPETQVLTDIAAGNLANVTWVVPSAANSDHDGFDKKTGPSWVASIVNAISTSQFWPSTTILVIWDDWGGWYDHVPPQQLDALGLGFRVPLIAISPRAKTNYVSHVQYESASILAYIEHQFGLAPMAAADSRAGDLSDMFLPPGQNAKHGLKRPHIRQTYSTAEVLRAAREHPFEPDDD